MRYTTLSYPSIPMLYHAANGGFNNFYGSVSMQLQFNPAGFLEGRIWVADSFQSVEMTSNGVLFTIINANHDGGLEDAGCQMSEPCFGAQGLLVLAPSVINQVAEPVSLGLLCAGAIGMMAARRRRAGRRPDLARV